MMEISYLALRKFISDKRRGDCVKNKELSRKFTSLKWKVKNTYLIMLVRRLYGGPDPIH